MQNFVLPLGQRPKGRRVNKPTATALPHQAVPSQRRFFKFCIHRGQCPRVKEDQLSRFCPPENQHQPFRSASPVIGGPGDDAYEHRRKPGVHRRSHPAILWFLSDRSERNNRSPKETRPPGRNNKNDPRKEGKSNENRRTVWSGEDRLLL